MNEQELERKISAYDHQQLLQLWSQIEAGNTSGWAPGKALEYLIIRAFEIEGAEVKYPYSVRYPGVPDGEIFEQIDGIIYSDSLSCMVECKDWNLAINVEPIAKLRNQLLRRPGGMIGVVFSRNGFTDPAITLATYTAPQAILLWNGPEIGYALEQMKMREALLKKYRYCLEHAYPAYNISESKIP